jgi:hypothetical protein
MRSGVKSGQKPKAFSSTPSRKVFPEESFFSTYCEISGVIVCNEYPEEYPE